MVNVYLVMETPFVCWRSGLKAWQMILLVLEWTWSVHPSSVTLRLLEVDGRLIANHVCVR